MQLLIANGANPPKEPPVEKEKTTKKAGNPKKKLPDKNDSKKYVLTIFRDGCWRPLKEDEVEEFLGKNLEVGALLKNNELLSSIKIPQVAYNSTIYEHWDKAAKKIITQLWKCQGAWHFHNPVNPELFHIPDYPMIIKKPMDLGTIKHKLSNSEYANCKEFVADVELVFSNCIAYNGESSDFGLLGKSLREEFKKLCNSVSLDFYM